jgi:hypothetical protein
MEMTQNLTMCNYACKWDCSKGATYTLQVCKNHHTIVKENRKPKQHYAHLNFILIIPKSFWMCNCKFNHKDFLYKPEFVSIYKTDQDFSIDPAPNLNVRESMVIERKLEQEDY